MGKKYRKQTRVALSSLVGDSQTLLFRSPSLPSLFFALFSFFYFSFSYMYTLLMPYPPDTCSMYCVVSNFYVQHLHWILWMNEFFWTSPNGYYTISIYEHVRKALIHDRNRSIRFQLFRDVIVVAQHNNLTEAIADWKVPILCTHRSLL